LVSTFSSDLIKVFFVGLLLNCLGLFITGSTNATDQVLMNRNGLIGPISYQMNRLNLTCPQISLTAIHGYNSKVDAA
jgi:hypothetical protein